MQFCKRCCGLTISVSVHMRGSHSEVKFKYLTSVAKRKRAVSYIIKETKFRRAEELHKWPQVTVPFTIFYSVLKSSTYTMEVLGSIPNSCPSTWPQSDEDTHSMPAETHLEGPAGKCVLLSL